jgi:hypothetical protein
VAFAEMISLMIIPRALRTYHGSNNTHGYVRGFKGTEGDFRNTVERIPGNRKGAPNPGDPGVIKTQDDTFEHTPENATFKNIQRWEGRFGLPSTTMAGNGEGGFSKRTSDQFIAVYFTFRAISDCVPWDLTTKTASEAEVEFPARVSDPEDIWPPDTPQLPEPADLLNPFGIGSPRLRNPNPRWPFRVLDNQPPSNPGEYPKEWNLERRGPQPDDEEISWPFGGRYRTPRIPIILFDYSSTSETDSKIVGTH